MNPPCSMCFNWKDGRSPRYHNGLTVEDIKRFGEHLQLAHEVINCGIGEPLLNRDLIPILQLFHDWGKPFGFNSNGLALSPALTERMVPYFEILTILFSLDAATAETYAKVRGLFFDRVVANIAHYSARRREIAPEGFASKTGVVFMPMRSNRRETADFIRLGARLGVDVVELRALNRIDENWVVRRGDFTFDYFREILTPAELEEIRQEAAEVAAAEGIRLDCQYQVSPESTFAFFLPPQYRDLGIRCVLPWRFILPYQNGDTAPCCFISEDLGDWRKTGLEDLWNGPFMQDLRGRMATGELARPCRRFPSCPVVQADAVRGTPPPFRIRRRAGRSPRAGRPGDDAGPATQDAGESGLHEACRPGVEETLQSANCATASANGSRGRKRSIASWPRRSNACGPRSPSSAVSGRSPRAERLTFPGPSPTIRPWNATEMLARIAAIKAEVDAANVDIIRRLIAERRIHVQTSHRASLPGKLINGLRRKLLFEVERGFEPVFERQREIDLRLLKEIETLKAALEQKGHGACG